MRAMVKANEMKTITGQKVDFSKIRDQFPVLASTVRGKPLAYLDNAATTQKPWAVIDKMRDFDSREYATVRRGAYRFAEQATHEFEEVRAKVALFLKASSPEEIVFTSGATMGVNLVAGSWGRKFIGEGDEIILSHLEHHANILPWQMLAQEKGAVIKVIPVNDAGELDMEEYGRLLSSRTKLVAVNHVANSIGTINPVQTICQMAKAAGAVTLVDGAQAAPHMKIDVREIGCDFYVLSAHKMYGPSGLGVLYGRKEALERTPPFLTGGDMIERVTFEKSTFAKPPHRFEAGTPPVTQVIGLGAAIDFLSSVGMDHIEQQEKKLLDYATELVSRIETVNIIGAARDKAAIISFTLADAHPHDVATILDSEGVAVRAGHHCAQPTMDRFCVPATTRASFSFYNTFEEVERLAEGIKQATDLFRG
ncbi:MAG: cysteine desulfurase [Nitrospinota bacterium]|nr:cysteine desulfurase [Nitrospinota bacterium]